MIHAEWIGRLDAYLDGELASAETQNVDQHLRACPECAAESLRRVQWKRAVRSAGERYKPDAALRGRIQRKIAKGRERRPWMRWALVSALGVLIVAGAVGFEWNARRSARDQLASELVDLHVATLASSSPVDVVSTDRHTVKPWFEGKIPFTFDLPELQGTAFELVGGRVSYLEQSPGAELIFRLRKHQISVFIFQERGIAHSITLSGRMETRSYHLETFERDGLRYFVIGDVGGEDLQALSALLRKS